jgi:hypothetical protein
MKSIKENNAIVGSMQKSILKKRNMQPLIREDHRMEDAFRSDNSGNSEDSREG